MNHRDGWWPPGARQRCALWCRGDSSVGPLVLLTCGERTTSAPFSPRHPSPSRRPPPLTRRWSGGRGWRELTQRLYRPGGTVIAGLWSAETVHRSRSGPDGHPQGGSRCSPLQPRSGTVGDRRWCAVGLARANAIALVGVQGHVVEIEADIENGLVTLLLVGLPDTALREARDRIRSAIVNSGETW